MSYGQFGYPAYSTPSQLVVGSTSSTTSPSISCCDSRRGMTPDPHTDPAQPTSPPSAAAVCPLPAAAAAAAAYESRLLSSYPRLATAGLTGTTSFFNGTSYGPEQAGYGGPLTTGVEPTAFYTNLNSAYGIKDTADPWRGLAQPASYYYDPTLAAYGYGSLDFNGARRKNVTRDSTTTLKAWLHEHRKNPYPTKGEKIMLAIITKMTLTQVSTWFANARRRLKKENKMTWEPRNKSEADDHDDLEGSSAKGKELASDDCDWGSNKQAARDGSAESCGEDSDARGTSEVTAPADVCRDSFSGEMNTADSHRSLHSKHLSGVTFPDSTVLHPNPTTDSAETSAPTYTPSAESESSASPDLQSIDSLLHSPQNEHPSTGSDNPVVCGDPLNSGNAKPKIWSLADTATSKSPNPAPSAMATTPQGLDPYCSNGHPDVMNAGSRAWFATSGYSVSARPGPGPTGQFVSYHQHGATSGTVPVTYGGGVHGFSPVSPQTDTPPQTPPNMKVSTSLPFHHLGSSYSASNSQAAHLYIGQGTTVCTSAGQLSHIPVEKSLCMYPLNHVNGFTSAISGSRDEYAQPLTERCPPATTFRAPPVQ